MSKAAIVIASLIVAAGATLVVLAYRGETTGDGQEALVIPFLIFWTVVAVFFVWLIDLGVRSRRRPRG